MKLRLTGNIAGCAALYTGAATAALAVPGAAYAQATPGDAVDDFEGTEIVVTATKREQTLQEVPVSVSVTSGETLEQAQIRDVLDLQTVTPSLRVSQLQNSSNTTFIVRGFGNGDNNFGIEPSVGVFIDGVFRSRSAASLGDIPNVKRIEVLRGPQSTLFGKNASAGVISVVTQEPQFDFGGSVEASYGNRNAIVVKGDVTGPISDSLAFSIDGSYNKRDGYARIVNLDNAELSNRNRWAVRGQLLFQPSSNFKIRAQADYSKIDEVCCTISTVVSGPTTGAINALGGALSTDFFSYDVYANQLPINKIDNYGGSIQMDWESDTISVTSITAYRELKNFFDQDVDFTSADIVSEIRDQDVKTFTQELRVASDFDGPFNFLLGGFYFDESIDQASQLTTGTQARDFFEILAGGNPADVLAGNPSVFNGVEAALGLAQESIFAPGLLTQEQYSVDNTSWSIFGTVDFELFEGFVLTGGFNYTDDKKDFALAQQSFDPFNNINLVDAFIVGGIAAATMTPPAQIGPAEIAAFQTANPAAFNTIVAQATNPATNMLLGLAPFQFQPPFLTIPNAVEPGQTNDDKLTYTIRAAYDVTDNINVYFSYATGFKASSVNLSRDSRPSATDYTPGPFNSTILAPPSAILNAGIAVPNLRTGSRFAGPEDAEVFEIGLKGQFDRVGFNLAVFDQAIEGFQSFLFTGTGFQLNNAGKQSVRGFEFDATFSPVDNLVFTFATTHLDPLYDSFTESPVGDLSGQRPGGIPAWTIATSATYTHELGDSGNLLTARIDYSHESNTNVNDGLPTYNVALGNTQIFRREINLVNGSLMVELENGLEFGVWGRNLLNDEYILTVFDGVVQAGTVSGYPSPPRTWGGTVRFKF